MLIDMLLKTRIIGKWPSHALTQNSKKKERKKEVVGAFYFHLGNKEKHLFLLRLAEPMQTWQRQVICLADQFCGFSHSGICRFYASSSLFRLYILLPRWCPSSSHLSPQSMQMDWHISDVGPLLHMHQSCLSFLKFGVISKFTLLACHKKLQIR